MATPSTDRDEQEPYVKMQVDDDDNGMEFSVSGPSIKVEEVNESFNKKQETEDIFQWQRHPLDVSNPTKAFRAQEESLDVALYHAEQITELVSSRFQTAYKHFGRDEDDIIGPTHLDARLLKQWALEAKSLKNEHDNFEVKVGLAGATGAGKTSIMNAILGYRNLLPSSEEEAATAVVCEISYNENCPYPFYAVANFQTEQELAEELDQFFDTLSRLKSLQQEVHDDPSANEEILSNLDQGFEKIKLIWGLELKNLHGFTTATLLALDPNVLGLLGKTTHFSGNQAEEFSSKIKPYLDSSSTSHGHRWFPAWPLLKKVKLFVKSELLRGGVTLVDLPGIGDMVQSRAQVARRHFNELAVTIIVTPACRAADEKACASLLTEHQELQMRMDGKFNPNSFCICLSKIDDIDCESFLRGGKNDELKRQLHADRERSRELGKRHQYLTKEVTSQRQKLSSNANQVNKIVAKLQMMRKPGASSAAGVRKSGTDGVARMRLENTRRILQREGEESQTQLSEMEREISANREEHGYLRSRIKHACVIARNANISTRLRQDFRHRQEQFEENNINMAASAPRGEVRVFPTCARAFWDEDGDTRTDGFPTKAYTGIPALQAFIRKATMEHRGRHAREQLTKYHPLLNRLRTWTASSAKKGIVVSRKRLNKEILDKQYDKLAELAAEYFGRLVKDVHRLEPLKFSTRKSMTTCGKDAMAKIESWHFAAPGDPKGARKLPWPTYNACVTREGGVHTSSGKFSGTRHWIGDLAAIFLGSVIGSWCKAIDEDIPEIAKSLDYDLIGIFSAWYEETQELVIQVQPRLEPYLFQQADHIKTIARTVATEGRQPFGCLRQESAEIREKLEKSLTKQMEAPFKKASKVEIGKGRYKRMIEKLRVESKKKRNKLYKDSSSHLQAYLNGVLKALPDKFLQVESNGIRLVKSQITAMLTNVASVDETELNETELAFFRLVGEIKRETLSLVRSWMAGWQQSTGADVSMHDVCGNHEIPKEFPAQSSGTESYEDDIDLDPFIQRIMNGTEECPVGLENDERDMAAHVPASAMEVDDASWHRHQDREQPSKDESPLQSPETQGDGEDTDHDHLLRSTMHRTDECAPTLDGDKINVPPHNVASAMEVEEASGHMHEVPVQSPNNEDLDTAYAAPSIMKSEDEQASNTAHQPVGA
ncbi:hypothetical protein MKZ38_003566 [Zalerion maritima]|uniref:Dynamin N-terminal domain-containing protein n=1 Tax=Zalerion maritima TaxID=339359 RepID=A0AAD5WRP2_9PEZI|nr:hypothetical protein MKZ38_003566 [Zalerion maritima]